MDVQRVLVDLSKVEIIQIVNDTGVIIQFASGTTKVANFKSVEEAESLIRAFVDWNCKERSNSLYIIWQNDFAEVKL